MASSSTVQILLDTIKREKDISDPYAYAVGMLGAMADEKEVLASINYMTTKDN